MEICSHIFEDCEELRSEYIRSLILKELETPKGTAESLDTLSHIPKRLVRYWHDPANLPADVRACLESWDPLVEEGFEFRIFDDQSAAAYIKDIYGRKELEAFARCAHPAMRCDYLRLCYLLAEGGLYVDADDVLIGDGWINLFRNGKLKLQPLCYDMDEHAMTSVAEIWRNEMSNKNRIFYVNNDPIAAPAGHPVLIRALARATDKLLQADRFPEIQSTTGPGNLTVALATHAKSLEVSGLPFDFELLRDWEAIAEMRWDLGYRKDSRNWRNVYGC